MCVCDVNCVNGGVSMLFCVQLCVHIRVLDNIIIEKILQRCVSVCSFAIFGIDYVFSGIFLHFLKVDFSDGLSVSLLNF